MLGGSIKTILKTFKPQECEQILSGKQSIFVMKSIPKAELPFRVLMCCSKKKEYRALYINEKTARKEIGTISTWIKRENELLVNIGTINEFKAYYAHGKVVAEFIVNNINEIYYAESSTDVGVCVQTNISILKEKSCLSQDEILSYMGNREIIYAWHITDLKVFDKPRELGEFKGKRKVSYYEMPYDTKTFKIIERYERLTKAPQNYMYVEEI